MVAMKLFLSFILIASAIRIAKVVDPNNTGGEIASIICDAALVIFCIGTLTAAP
jgi:hypothetical protein